MTTQSANRAIRYWFIAGAVMVFLILIVGGITRLTNSGLSIVEWKPISGVIPPLTDAQWQAEFDLYRQFPEYQVKNRGMSMSEFQYIFFWEYLHRMLARGIGLVFLFPFIWFASKRMFTTRQLKQSMFLFLLGFAQGFMGWYMVQSGLVEDPYVSPFRLAAHLMLAFVIFAACVWFALETLPHSKIPGVSAPVSSGNSDVSASDFRKVTEKGFGASSISLFLWVFGVVLLIQIVWGAFVAGHKAGYIYNTFPLMEGTWFPPQLLVQKPVWVNFFENLVSVQWVHRVMGTVLLVSAGLLAWRAYFNADVVFRRTAYVLAALVALQYLLGVLTLLYRVPISLGVLHQAMALVLVGVMLLLMHRLVHVAAPR